VSDLLAALKKYFGYESFRPLQEEIIRDALAGRDVFALLPTGGGKSLCFQLPALLRDGMTIVVSPLIALMKDQVDALTASGVAATFLNSTLGEVESRARLRGLHNGEYRLLYVAPERLLHPSFIERLRSFPINLVAIDEAHCISEWGHDFRPEYHQLATLRDHLPDTPVMALTATATGRVREDIVERLRLRAPRRYVASFNRPNLVYRVAGKQGAYEQVRSFIAEREDESGIIYCQSRKSAEGLAEKLRANGVAARPYHAGLADSERAGNQEQFLRDDVRCICATIAFGMGINKPNVRYVIHYDLPKNIEGYYQETGRAGRDGLPSECLLLFTAGDVVKYGRFIDEMTNAEERRVAREQLQQMVHYAECPTCRRVALLGYFGETFPPNCGACDNCLAPRDTFDGTLAGQKFLSTVIRARQSSHSGAATFGLNHHIDVLLGLDGERIQRWQHQQLTTYGIGTEHTRTEWAAIARELIRLGYLAQITDKFTTVDVTAEGLDTLRSRRPITLTRPVAVAEGGAKGKRVRGARAPAKTTTRSGSDTAWDRSLFDKLRKLRRELADERNVPAYIVFSDAAIRDMATLQPRTEAEFLHVSGVGEKKLADFGAIFIAAIREHRDRAGDPSTA
jgi:ATP-dependent DNA helicase RecQ